MLNIFKLLNCSFLSFYLRVVCLRDPPLGLEINIDQENDPV